MKHTQFARRRLADAALSPDRHDSFQITPTPDSLFMPNTKLRELTGDIRPAAMRAMIVDQWIPDDALLSISALGFKYKAIHERLINARSWEDIGVIDRYAGAVERNGVLDGCRSRADVIAKYDNLDRVIDAMEAEGLCDFRSKPKENFRDGHGDTMLHFGPDGTPVFGWGGQHRLSVCALLGIPVICRVGVIHAAFLDQYLAGDFGAGCMPVF